MSKAVTGLRSISNFTSCQDRARWVKVTSASRPCGFAQRRQRSSRDSAPHLCAFSSPAALSQTTAELKAAVVRAVGGTQRGKAATPAQRAAILSLLQALEGHNTEPAPAQSPLLSGVWALLYQAPLDEARAAVDRSGTTEGPFLAAFQPVTGNFVRTRANLQLLDLPAGRAENLADFTVADRWGGALNIVGTATPQTGPQGEPSHTRVDVVFTHFELRLGESVKLTIPLDWVKPKGWIETTYLDEDMRIGRGDKGSIFVASRVKSSRWRGAEPAAVPS